MFSEQFFGHPYSPTWRPDYSLKKTLVANLGSSSGHVVLKFHSTVVVSRVEPVRQERISASISYLQNYGLSTLNYGSITGDYVNIINIITQKLFINNESSQIVKDIWWNSWFYYQISINKLILIIVSDETSCLHTDPGSCLHRSSHHIHSWVRNTDPGPGVQLTEYPGLLRSHLEQLGK